MAKGDATSGPSMGQMSGQNQAAPNTKMDQYSVMHHLMQQLGQLGQSSMAPSPNGLGQMMGGQQLQNAIGSGSQMANNYQTQQQMPQMSGYQPQQLAHNMFSRSGIGPMMSNMGMQGSLAPQNRFRQQLNQQPMTEPATNQQV